MSNTINKTKVIGIRILPEYAKILFKVCSLRGEDVSDFVRRAILKELANLSYLTDDYKKALGIGAKNE